MPTNNEDNRIGKNIKAFREAYGETQEDLANAINTTPNNISMYEHGKRHEQGIIKDIANHFLVSVLELESRDFTSIDEEHLFGPNLYKNIDIFFPMVMSEEVIKNVSFKETYELHNKIYNKFKTFEKKDYIDMMKNEEGGQKLFEDLTDILKKCSYKYMEIIYQNIKVEEYNLEVLNDEIVAASALNHISISYFLFCMDYNEKALYDRTAVFTKLKSLYPEIAEYIINDKTYIEEDSMINSIAHLRPILSQIQTQKWKDLLYYYIAWQHILNDIDNDLDPNINKLIGWEMLSSFSGFGTSYATNLLNLF